MSSWPVSSWPMPLPSSGSEATLSRWCSTTQSFQVSHWRAKHGTWKNVIPSRILKYGCNWKYIVSIRSGWIGPESFFMLVAGEDRQIVRRLDRTDPLAALLKGIHLPILQMQPCPGQDANVFPARYVQVQHFR